MIILRTFLCYNNFQDENFKRIGPSGQYYVGSKLLFSSQYDSRDLRVYLRLLTRKVCFRFRPV